MNPETIKDKDLHVWMLGKDQIDDSLASSYLDLLNEQEKSCYEQFRSESKQKEYLYSRALVHTVLSIYQPEIAPHTWEFDKGEFGKPEISHSLSSTIKFNLSHSKNMIVLATTIHSDIGVDVEYMQRRVRCTDIAQRYFTENETSELMSSSESERQKLFFKLWTIKEAMGKASGQGLSAALDSIGISITDNGIILTENNATSLFKEKQYKCWQATISPDYILSLAVLDNKKSPCFEGEVICHEIVPHKALNKRVLNWNVSRIN